MRTSLTLVALFGATTMGLAQGEVLFSAGATSTTRIYTNSWWMNPQGGQVGPINQPVGFWTFALFSAPSTVTSVIGHTPWLDPAWWFTGVYGTNTGVLGRMAGWTPGHPNNAAVIPGFAPGSVASLMVIGWNTFAGGVTLASFINAYNQGSAGLCYGYSEIGHIPLGDGGLISDVNLFGTGAGQIPGFSIYVPEPSSFALTSLGGATLLLVRRLGCSERRLLRSAIHK